MPLVLTPYTPGSQQEAAPGTVSGAGFFLHRRRWAALIGGISGSGSGGQLGSGNAPFTFDFVVAPTGGSASTTAGTLADPFSLTYAIAGAGGRIVAGKVVALRGSPSVGTYTNSYLYICGLNGARGSGLDSQTSKIIFRSYPGEEAYIDGTFRLNGTYLWLWGLNIFSSDPVHAYVNHGDSAGNAYGIRDGGSQNKVINCRVHDHGKSGLLMGTGNFPDTGNEAEVYGVISYNNGTFENLDHGSYNHNSSTTGVRKRIRESVYFTNLTLGFQTYDDSNDLRSFDHVGVIAFNNTTISTVVGNAKANILVGANGGICDDVTFSQCFTYHKRAVGTGGTYFGYGSGVNGKIVVDSCYFGGGAAVFYSAPTNPWTNATFTNNKFVPRAAADLVVNTGGAISGYTWGSNTHYDDPTLTRWQHGGSNFTFVGWKAATGLGGTDATTGALRTTTDIFVRANAYEPGRGHVVAYNWSLATSINVDISPIVTVGSSYTVYSMSDLETALMTGTYAGGTINLPMSTTTPRPPQGPGRQFLAADITEPEFDCFLIKS